MKIPQGSLLGPPVAPYLFFFFSVEGSPTKMDYDYREKKRGGKQKKKRVPTCSSLSAGGPSLLWNINRWVFLWAFNKGLLT